VGSASEFGVFNLSRDSKRISIEHAENSFNCVGSDLMDITATDRSSLGRAMAYGRGCVTSTVVRLRFSGASQPLGSGHQCS
jgi:hypothetical protein